MRTCALTYAGNGAWKILFRDAGYAFFILSIDPYTFLPDFPKQFLVIYDLLQVQNAIIAH